MRRLSVEISTCNRCETLRQVLTRLAEQTFPPHRFEVVISDDGSLDETVEMVEALKLSLPYATRIVSHDHKGCGPTHNAGIYQCQGDLVLMLADDLIPQPQLLEEHVKAHEKNPSLSTVVVGGIEQSPYLAQTAVQRGWDAVIDATWRSVATKLDYTVLWLSNASFKRDFMLEHGMFRDWPANAGEDVELGYRLQQKGMTLVYNSRALAYHHHPVTLESVVRKWYDHGYKWQQYLEAEIPVLGVRLISENIKPSDGWSLFLKTRSRNRLRAVLLNRLTVPWLAMPLARRADKISALAFLMPFLVRKIVSYHFFKGLNDYRDQREGLGTGQPKTEEAGGTPHA